MDAAEASWAVVADDASVAGWLARAAATGDGTAGDRVEPAPHGRARRFLETALAAILAGNAPGAIVTDGRPLRRVSSPRPTSSSAARA